MWRVSSSAKFLVVDWFERDGTWLRGSASRVSTFEEATVGSAPGPPTATLHRLTSIVRDFVHLRSQTSAIRRPQPSFQLTGLDPQHGSYNQAPSPTLPAPVHSKTFRASAPVKVRPKFSILFLNEVASHAHSHNFLGVRMTDDPTRCEKRILCWVQAHDCERKAICLRR
jgi:hypothetical protein